jgi:hypothetical protein
MSNPASQIPIFQRTPTRLVPGGNDITLLAGTSVQFPGSNQRQDRIIIIFTNLDLGLNLTIRNFAHVNCFTVFPQQAEIIESNADMEIYNGGALSMVVQVCEFYADPSADFYVQQAIQARAASGK